MPKFDPKGEVPNPIRAKLAHDIAKPLSVVSLPSPKLETQVIVDLPHPQPRAERTEEPDVISTKLAKPKKVLFTVMEQKANDAVVADLAEVIGADTLGWSHVNRAMWCLLRRSQDQLVKHRRQAPKLMRPSNGNPIELAKFEDSLAEYLLVLFKDMPRG